MNAPEHRPSSDASLAPSARPGRTTWRERLRPWLYLVLPLVFLSLTTPSCQTGYNPVSGNTRALGYSWQEEVRLGEQADQQIQQQYGVYDEGEVVPYVTELGEAVLQESHLRAQARSDLPQAIRNTPFTFRVLDSPIINAFALPGGYVYVTRGLMAHMNNEAQLAMVLGHEVAHVAARHSSQRAARQQISQGLLLGGALAGAAAGVSPESILQLGGTAAQLLTLSYSRDQEREADRLGVDYSGRRGYKASEGAAFFRTLERIRQVEGQAIPTWQSTHPDPGEREETIQQLAADLARQLDGIEMTEVDQETYYRRLDGMVLGNNPRQGFDRDGTFYHPDLEFRFPVPSGWQVFNQTSFVALVQPDQQAQIILQLEEQSPSAAAGAFASQQGLSVVDRTQRRFNGLTAEVVLAEGQTQQGQTLRILGYFFDYGGTTYAFQAVAGAQSYGRFSDVFRRTIEGFDQLTDRDILGIQPARIAIVEADRPAPFRSFVDEDALPMGMTAEDLAIINHVELDEQIARGQMLKLPAR